MLSFYSEVLGLRELGTSLERRRLQRTIDNLSDVASVKPRPTNRPYAEFRFRDPEGNRLDLSQTKGWEVDVDKWEYAG